MSTLLTPTFPVGDYLTIDEMRHLAADAGYVTAAELREQMDDGGYMTAEQIQREIK